MTILKQVERNWLIVQDALATLCCCGMIIGLMWSRALLSISMIVLLIDSLHPSTIGLLWRRTKNDWFTWGCLIFFMGYAVSLFWSQDKTYWWSVLTDKLPFLFLPFAFRAVPLKKVKWQKIIVWVLLVAHWLVILYSLQVFFSNFHYYVATYGQSNSLPTTKYDDHIRFSLSVSLSFIVTLYYLFFNKRVFSRLYERIFLWFTAGLFFVYIHVLSSKTGILVIYSIGFCFLFYGLSKAKKQKVLLRSLIVGGLAFPFLLYFAIPTFRQRINYVRYEWTVSHRDTLSYQLSDAGRIISYKVARDIWSRNKLFGSGAGDLRNEVNETYARLYPGVPADHRLTPHNQFIHAFTALGLIFGCCVLVLCVSSFWSFPRPMFFGRLTAFVLVLAMMAEAMLEVQFGVFIYLFFLLFWKGLPALKGKRFMGR